MNATQRDNRLRVRETMNEKTTYKGHTITIMKLWGKPRWIALKDDKSFEVFIESDSELGALNQAKSKIDRQED